MYIDLYVASYLGIYHLSLSRFNTEDESPNGFAAYLSLAWNLHYSSSLFLKQPVSHQ